MNEINTIPYLDTQTPFSFLEEQRIYFETEEKTKDLEKSTITREKYLTNFLPKEPKKIKTIPSNKFKMVIGNIEYNKPKDISLDYSMAEIQRKAKEKYGIILSDDPTEE